MLKQTFLFLSRRLFIAFVGVVFVVVVFAATLNVVTPAVSDVNSSQSWVLVEKPLNFSKILQSEGS